MMHTCCLFSPDGHMLLITDTWGRVPFVRPFVTKRGPFYESNGSYTMRPAPSFIRQNFIICNWECTWPIDHDDGSQVRCANRYNTPVLYRDRSARRSIPTHTTFCSTVAPRISWGATRPLYTTSTSTQMGSPVKVLGRQPIALARQQATPALITTALSRSGGWEPQATVAKVPVATTRRTVTTAASCAVQTTLCMHSARRVTALRTQGRCRIRAERRFSITPVKTGSLLPVAE
jgi:hypothetical protein